MTNKNFEALYTEYNELIQQFQQLQQNVGALEKHVNDLNELFKLVNLKVLRF